MRKRILTLLLVITSATTFSQSYSTTGGILPVYPDEPGAGGDFYNLEVPDDFTIENLKVRVVAHILEHDGDTVSILDNFGLEIWHDGDEIYLYDHSCTYTPFSTLDWTFSDEAESYVNESCVPSSSHKTTNIDRFGEELTTDLSVYDGQNAGGLWQFYVTWKPYTLGGGPDNPLSIDNLILIFDSGALSINDENYSKGLKVYPNPISNRSVFQIDNNVNEKFDITIYDLSGKVVHLQKGNKGKTTITIPEVNRGTYLLEITNANGVKEQELIVVN